MPTPAERIYEAASDALAAQQARADQITNQIGPIGAGAAAAALLLKPGLHDISHANVPQLAGLVAGVLGLFLVLGAGILVLIGIKIKGVEAVDLVDLGAGPPDLMADSQTFDVEAATKLGRTRTENAKALRTLRQRFFVVAVGLLLEVAGLAVAAEVQPGAKAKPPMTPTLRVTGATARRGGVTLKGAALGPSVRGRVVVVVTFHGRGSQTISRVAPLTSGRFAVHITARPGLRPVHSATYTITWTGPSGATSARLSGTIKRGPTH